MTVNGIDYAGGRPSGATISAAGYSFACRYLSPGGASLPGKQLTAAEVADLHAHGIGIVFNWETSGVTAKGGYSAGVSDAQQASAAAAALGWTPDRPIYFSLDWDATAQEQVAINAYFQGVASVIGLPATGVYGGYWPVSRALDAGVVRWAWQTLAWSGGNQDPRINLLQHLGWVYVDGVQCDLNTSLTDDFGQWPSPTPQTGPLMALTDQQQQQLLDAVLDIQIQLRGLPGGNGTFNGWPELGERNDGGGNRTPVDALAHLVNPTGSA